MLLYLLCSYLSLLFCFVFITVVLKCVCRCECVYVFVKLVLLLIYNLEFLVLNAILKFYLEANF